MWDDPLATPRRIKEPELFVSRSTESCGTVEKNVNLAVTFGRPLVACIHRGQASREQGNSARPKHDCERCPPRGGNMHTIDAQLGLRQRRRQRIYEVLEHRTTAEARHSWMC